MVNKIFGKLTYARGITKSGRGYGLFNFSKLKYVDMDLFDRRHGSELVGATVKLEKYGKRRGKLV